MKIGKTKKKIIYIAEFSLPNMSAYAVHVLKMCDNLCKHGYDVELVLPFVNNSYFFSKIKKDYLLKNKYKIKSIFKSKFRLNFLLRILFSIRIFFYLKKLSLNIILSRSIIPSLILAFLNIKNTLEIHTEVTGFTYYFFKLNKFKKIKKNIKFVVLNSKLINLLDVKESNTIVLCDSVELKDFLNKKNKINKFTCAYSGSFVQGKGLEIIYQLAKKMPKINFDLYGNVKTLDKNFNFNSKPKNLNFKGFVSYKKITKILQTYKILLMPYQEKVDVLIKGVDVSNYFSPLKLFEYMAAGKVIVASKLKVYSKILKHKRNAILLKPHNINEWIKAINKIFGSSKFDYLGRNAKKDVKKYSWKERAKKIIQFSES